MFYQVNNNKTVYGILDYRWITQNKKIGHMRKLLFCWLGHLCCKNEIAQDFKKFFFAFTWTLKKEFLA